ncbi:MAG: hypothetical protein ACYC0X_34170 [Pirellulaceae bacterium]
MFDEETHMEHPQQPLPKCIDPQAASKSDSATTNTIIGLILSLPFAIGFSLVTVSSIVEELFQIEATDDSSWAAWGMLLGWSTFACATERQ